MSHRLLSKDTVVSFDIETTGLVAGVHSMIALGAVAYRDGKEIGHYYGALDEFEGSERSQSTMDFWMKNLPEWKRIRKNRRDPAIVMKEFYDWCIELPQPRILAANPSAFDSAFLFWYLHTFVGEEAVHELFKRNRALDIRSYISALLAVPYSEAERPLIPKQWSEGFEITHNALDDAREQGTMLVYIMKALAGELELDANAE
jgi:DNA polymerase III alpha subunit (gram-positive type)